MMYIFMSKLLMSMGLMYLPSGGPQLGPEPEEPPMGLSQIGRPLGPSIPGGPMETPLGPEGGLPGPTDPGTGPSPTGQEGLYGMAVNVAGVFPHTGKDTVTVMVGIAMTPDISYTRAIWREMETKTRINHTDTEDLSMVFSSIDINPASSRSFEVEIGAVKSDGAWLWTTLHIAAPETTGTPIVQKTIAPTLVTDPPGTVVYTKGQDTRIKVSIPQDEEFIMSARLSEGIDPMEQLPMPYMKEVTESSWKTYMVPMETSDLDVTGYVTYTVTKFFPDSQIVKKYAVEINQMMHPAGTMDIFPDGFLSLTPFHYYTNCTAAEDIKTPVLFTVPYLQTPADGTSVDYTCVAKTSTGVTKTEVFTIDQSKDGEDTLIK